MWNLVYQILSGVDASGTEHFFCLSDEAGVDAIRRLCPDADSLWRREFPFRERRPDCITGAGYCR